MSNKPLVVYGRLTTQEANDWAHLTIPQHSISLIITQSLHAYIYLVNGSIVIVDISGDPDADLKGDKPQAETNVEALSDYEHGN